MHAPRRSHALGRVPAAPQSSSSGSPSPAVGFSYDDAPADPEQLRNSRRASSEERTRGLSSLAKPNYFSPRSVRDPEVTAGSNRERGSQLSPRAMWRAPAPRPVPLPSLLPTVATSNTARTARPVGAQRDLSVESPATARGLSPSAVPAAAEEADVSDGYGDEYVRLVFDAPRSTSVTVDAGLTPQEHRAQHPPPPPLPQLPHSRVNSTRLPPVPSATTTSTPSSLRAIAAPTITDAQATAMLAQLPDHFPSARQEAARPPQNTINSTQPRVAQQTQPEAWWSTLDGTLSAYNSLQGTANLRSAAGVAVAGASYQNLPGAAQSTAGQNLNDTLGRADRAAMVLSMGHPQNGIHRTQNTDSVSAGAAPARSSDDRRTDEKESASATDSITAAVAALAQRLSRATAVKGSGGGDSNTDGVVDFTTSTLAHHNTLQELRDTLRMAQADVLDFQQQQQPQQQPLLTHGTASFTETLSDGSLSVDADPQQHTDRRPRQHRPAPLISIVKPPQSRSTPKEPPALTSSGLGGVGSKRTRDALARLYAEPNTTAQAATAAATAAAAALRENAGGGGVAAPTLGSAPQRQLSFLSRSGPSMAAPAPPISTDSEMRSMPWQCETLTRDTVERRFGPLEAAHTAGSRAAARRRLQRHHASQSAPRQPSSSHQSAGVTQRGKRVAARLATGLQPPSAQQQQQQRQEAPAVSSPTSSVSSAVFSCVSLTSSIFVREVGDGETLRQSYVTMMAGTTADAGGVRTATSSALPSQAQPSPQPSRGGEAETANAAAAAAQYRREQQRLYASHLTTASRALAGSDTAGTDAIEPYLDVDYLFSDIKPRPRDYTLTGKARPLHEMGGGVRAPAPDVVKDHHKLNAAGVGAADTASSSPPAPRDALQAALQARAALLRRHVQSSPAWERLLYKVRQWCDRTVVMVQLDNGECVEQTGARPPQPARQAFTSNENTAAHGGAPLTAETASVAGMDGIAASPPPPHYVYMDDPAAAHEQQMQQVAHESEDVQRRNALQRCRQRQQQWETAMHTSTLVVSESGGTSAAASPLLADDSVLSTNYNDLSHSTNVSMQSMQGLGWGSRRSTGTTLSTWAKTSINNDSAAAAAAAVFERVRESSIGTASEDARLIDARAGATSSTVPALQSAYTENFPNQTGAIATSADDFYDNTASAPLNTQATAGVSSAPLRCSAVRGATSQHAALCSKLQTWGDPVEEATVGGESGEGGDEASSELQGDGNAGPLVLWKRESANPLAGDGRGPTLRLPFASFDSPADRLSVVSTNSGGAAAHAGKPVSHRASFHCSGVERDLLAFILTCGSSSRTSGSAASSGLLPLLSLPQHSASPLPSPPAVDGGASGTQQALRAVQTILHDGFGVKTLSDVSSPLLRNSSAERSGGEQASPPPLAWEALVSAVLEGFSVFDFTFLKHLHALLWTYEGWRTEEEEKEKSNAADGGRRRQHGVTILPTTADLATEKPPPVWPLTLVTAHAVSGSSPPPQPAKPRNFNDGGGEDQPEKGDVTVDAADLFCALAAAPTLVLWLLDTHQSSPTSTWMDLIAAMPVKHQQEWHALVTACVTGVAPPSAAPTQTAASDTAELPFRHLSPSSARTTHNAAEEHDAARTASIVAFACEMPVAVSAIVWRQRVFHSLLKRALACAETGTNTTGTAATDGSHRTSTIPTIPSELANPLPCIGSTPYLPDEESRVNYPLDMRNGYLFSSLAREDVESRVVPQLRDTRRQFTDVLRAARAAAASHDAPHPLSAKASASLPAALQQRVPLHRLVQVEHRYLALLSTMWRQECSIRAFNAHVGTFNDFTRAEQRRWGPLYRSSLTVAYCVCEELAEKRMENVAPALLPFVSVVAAFMGCRGGHRELRTKLRTVMVDLVERAKKVQVHLDSLAWQGRRAQVLAEAVEAAQIAPRSAGAVVSVLATESDVVGVPLTAVELPAVTLRTSLPLPPSEE